MVNESKLEKYSFDYDCLVEALNHYEEFNDDYKRSVNLLYHLKLFNGRLHFLEMCYCRLLYSGLLDMDDLENPCLSGSEISEFKEKFKLLLEKV